MLQKHLDELNALRDDTYDLARRLAPLASATQVLGLSCTNDIRFVLHSLDEISKRIGTLSHDLVNTFYTEAQESSANLLKTALAVATEKDKSNE
jgi:hypothetical protein